jgi:hypothetical protein
MPDPSNLEAFASSVLAAVTSGNWALLAALVLVGVVFLARRFGAKRVPFLATARGGALLALLGGVAGAIATALASGGPVSVALVLSGLQVGFLAAGGWTVLKKLLFGDVAADAIAGAEDVGQAAGLAAAPGAPTVDSILGTKP